MAPFHDRAPSSSPLPPSHADDPLDAKYRSSSSSSSSSSSRTQSKTLRASVCKIHFHGKAYDFDQPYNTHRTASRSTGTGFVLDAFPPGKDERGEAYVHIVTAYHVVDHATRVMCEFTKRDGDPIQAELVVYSAHLDVALLRVRADAGELGVTPLVSGDSDALQPTDEVAAAGFALGHDYQITSGTVSGRSNLVQVDCAVNGGNSGGPLLDASKRVVGVVVSGYDPGVAQNINFVSPIFETVACLRWALGSGVASVPSRSLNVTLVSGSAELYSRDACAQAGCPHGGYVTQVHPHSALHAAGLRRRDVLCSVGGYDLDLRAKVEVEWWPVDRLDLHTLMERLQLGEEVDVSFWSRRAGAVVRRRVRVEAERDAFRTVDPLVEPPRYCCRGGMVVQPLLHNHSSLSRSYRHILRQPQVREQSLLVITFLRPESPFTTMDAVGTGDIVVYVNDRPVRTIDEYVQEWRRWWEASDEPCVTLTLYDGNIAVAGRAELLSSDAVTVKETNLSDLDQHGPPPLPSPPHDPPPPPSSAPASEWAKWAEQGVNPPL